MSGQTWEELADRYGPQTAAYQYSADWDGKLRTVQCACGALVEVLEEDNPIAKGDYLCDSCQLKHAFTIEEAWNQERSQGDKNTAVVSSTRAAPSAASPSSTSPTSQTSSANPAD